VKVVHTCSILTWLCYFLFLMQQSTKIFDSPLEEKKRCTIQTNNRGWSGMHAETLDPKNQKIGDLKE
jgi:hypothetical protein